MSHCDTEIEKDIDKEKELYIEKKPFSFSDEKKGERFYEQNNFLLFYFLSYKLTVKLGSLV